MAKPDTYKLEWVGEPIGKEWKLPDGWALVQVLLPLQEQKGKVMALLRGTDKE